MANQEYVKSHYLKLISEHEHSPLFSLKDQKIRNAETKWIIKKIQELSPYLSNNNIVLDFGAGNGHLLAELSKSIPHYKYLGVEWIDELVLASQKRKLLNVDFFKDDIRDSKIKDQSVSVCITERVIINLLSWKQQVKAFEEIHRVLKTGGSYLMIESFKGSLINLNLARQENGLADIEMSKHNRFLSDSTIEVLAKMGLMNISKSSEIHQLSNYFFNARVLHPLISSKTRYQRNSHITDYFTKSRANQTGQYSPIRFYHFKKIF